MGVSGSDRANDPQLSGTARRARILERIQTMGGASLAELAREHAVSPVTVHRDLEQLSRDGLVERFHGGARAIARPGTRIETAWERRLRESGSAKDAIAAHARGMIEDGATVFLDASSTCFALAHRIELEPPEELVIVTNSPAIALGLEGTGVRVIVAPGEVDLRARAIADGWTVEFLRRLHFDAAFVSGAGLDLAHGLTTTSRQLADTIGAASAAAAQTVALVDTAKFGRASLVPIAPVDALDRVVADDRLADEVAEEYRRAGVALELAPALPAGDDD
jgi:DeoR/GlpR family transcriptional regulator of sugar metabolism